MAEPELPEPLEAAFARLERAMAGRADGPAENTAETAAEIATLKEKLAVSDAEVARLRAALEKAEARRLEAATRLDAAAEKLDGLLAEPEEA